MCTAMESFLFKAECRSLTYPEYRESQWSDVFKGSEYVIDGEDIDVDPVLWETELIAMSTPKNRNKARERRINMKSDKEKYLKRKAIKPYVNDSPRQRKIGKRIVHRAIRHNGNHYGNGLYLADARYVNHVGYHKSIYGIITTTETI